MFETLIASGLCFYVNAQGQTIELTDLCVDSVAAATQTQYTTRESAFLAQYRQLHPDSLFTDAEVLFSGQVSCGEAATIDSVAALDSTITYEDETKFVEMLIQHWEASHTAARSQLCPGRRNFSALD